jgi:hypothetical protein
MNVLDVAAHRLGVDCVGLKPIATVREAVLDNLQSSSRKTLRLVIYLSASVA